MKKVLFIIIVLVAITIINQLALATKKSVPSPPAKLEEICNYLDNILGAKKEIQAIQFLVENQEIIVPEEILDQLLDSFESIANSINQQYCILQPALANFQQARQSLISGGSVLVYNRKSAKLAEIFKNKITPLKKELEEKLIPGLNNLLEKVEIEKGNHQ